MSRISQQWSVDNNDKDDKDDNEPHVCSTLHQAALTIGPEALQASSENFFLSFLFPALAVDVDLIHISDNSVHQNEHVNKLISGGFTW